MSHQKPTQADLKRSLAIAIMRLESAMQRMSSASRRERAQALLRSLKTLQGAWVIQIEDAARLEGQVETMLRRVQRKQPKLYG